MLNTVITPKFKVGDRLIWRFEGREFDCVIKEITPRGFYKATAYYTGTTKPFDVARHSTEISYAFGMMHNCYILYDSPEGIWLRL